MESRIKELVSLGKKGDESSISELISMHKNLIMGLAYGILRDYNSSMDILQETFFIAFKNLKKLKEEGKFKSWLCKIALNLCKNELKRRSLSGEFQKSKWDFKMFLENEKILKKRMIIEEAMKKLNFRDRTVLVLFYYKGFNLKEISEITGIKEKNLKMILCRARKKLREKLEGYEEELLS